MGGEGRGKKKKKEIPTSFFARKTRSVLHSRCTEKSVDGWMDGWMEEKVSHVCGKFFSSIEKKKNGKWKKGNDVDVDAENDISGLELERRRGGRERE